MSNEERAAKMSQEEIVALLESCQDFSARFDKTQAQLDWLKR